MTSTPSAARGLRLLKTLAGIALAIPACSTDPGGTLTITLDPPHAVTNAASITLTGTVTRDPVKPEVIFIQATGGKGSPVDTLIGDHFSFSVPLNPNAVNSIILSPTDADGSNANSVTATVRQDGGVPTVVQTTPADTSDNVATGAPIQVKLSEPVVLGPNGGIALTRQGLPITGTTTVTADSLTLGFVPDQPLSPNAIYRVGFSGVSDIAGNLIPSSTSSCFATTIAGATSSVTFTDSTNDLLTSSPPPATAKPDLVAARFAREGPLFSGIFRFAGPRVFTRGASNQASIILDLDTDRDSTTGFVTQKDTLFLNSGPPLDTLSSGTRAEYVIGLTPLLDFGDSAYIGRYTSPLQFQVAGSFLPGVCGSLMGFMVPFTVLGNTDGHIHAVAVAFSGGGSAIFVDALPSKGFLDLDLPLIIGPVSEWRSGLSNPTVERFARSSVMQHLLSARYPLSEVLPHSVR